VAPETSEQSAKIAISRGRKARKIKARTCEHNLAKVAMWTATALWAGRSWSGGSATGQNQSLQADKNHPYRSRMSGLSEAQLYPQEWGRFYATTQWSVRREGGKGRPFGHRSRAGSTASGRGACQNRRRPSGWRTLDKRSTCSAQAPAYRSGKPRPDPAAEIGFRNGAT
jgi:hypothetical protein